MSDLLTGSVVLITGAGRGLGRSYAVAAAQAGATLVLNDRDEKTVASTAEEVSELGANVLAIAADLTQPGAAADLVEQTVRHHGRIDGVVNNAGVMQVGLPWEQEEPVNRLQVEVNVTATILLGSTALQHMVAARRGSIVNICSGAHVGMPNRATYCATKGAVASLTYAWALDARPFGVRINALSPVAHTPMFADAGDPTEGVSSPDAVAPLLVYLLSDLSADVSGQVVRLDGHELSVYARPMPQAAIEQEGGWTVEQIDRALGEGPLAAALTTW